MRSFRSPNSGQTSLTLQHSTSPRSGYRPPAGHNADGYTMPERVGFKGGGRAGAGNRVPERFRKKRELEEKRHKRMKVIRDQYEKRHPELKERGLMKKGGDVKKNGPVRPIHIPWDSQKKKNGGWIQDVNKSIKKRGTKGKCTPITKKGCTGRAKALAKTFKKMAKKRKGK